MKRILFNALLAVSMLLCAGCSRQAPTGEDMSSFNAEYAELVDKIGNTTNLIKDHRRYKDGKYLYPESYGGYYVEGKTLIVLVTDLGAVPEYQYLTDSYADTAFKKVEYSYNYLQGLIDEYIASRGDSYINYGSKIDCKENRAVVYVDEETLANIQPDSGTPLYFEEPPVFMAL